MIDIKTVEHLLDIYNEKLRDDEVKDKVLTKDETEDLKLLLKTM